MTSSADESASAERPERRSISSLFSSRRVSSGRLAPTLIVNDELQLESAADGRSLHSFGCLASRSGSVLGSPVLHPRTDSRRGRLASRGQCRVSRVQCTGSGQVSTGAGEVGSGPAEITTG